jgi:3-methyladenine DNA glycosylase AlkD
MKLIFKILLLALLFSVSFAQVYKPVQVQYNTGTNLISLFPSSARLPVSYLNGLGSMAYCDSAYIKSLIGSGVGNMVKSDSGLTHWTPFEGMTWVNGQGFVTGTPWTSAGYYSKGDTNSSTLGFYPRQQSDALFGGKQNVISNIADTSKYFKTYDSSGVYGWYRRAYIDALIAGKQNTIANLADTSKYVEYSDSSTTTKGWYRRGYVDALIASKQNTISNLADTSKYAKSTDSTLFYRRLYVDALLNAKQNSILNLADTSKYAKSTDSTLFYRRLYVDALLNAKQNVILNLADTSKYFEQLDSSSVFGWYKRAYIDALVATKQNVISNLSDTSKYFEAIDSAGTSGWYRRAYIDALIAGKQNTVANLSDTSKYVEYSDSSTTNGWYRRAFVDALVNAKQNIISNLADTSKYLEQIDSSSTNGWYRRAYIDALIASKQNTISNLADTSKYVEYSDSSTTNGWYRRAYVDALVNAKQNTIANLADTSKYQEMIDSASTNGWYRRAYVDALLSVKSPIAGSSSIVTVGTLTGGAIGTGFTVIDTPYIQMPKIEAWVLAHSSAASVDTTTGHISTQTMDNLRLSKSDSSSTIAPGKYWTPAMAAGKLDKSDTSNQLRKVSSSFKPLTYQSTVTANKTTGHHLYITSADSVGSELIDSTVYCSQTMIKGMLSRYQTILQSQGYLVATKVAGTYIIGAADSCQKSGNTHLMPMSMINILAADYPTVNGLTPKLRVSGIVSVNNTAPNVSFTIGLYPVTSGAGGAALKIYSVGSIVTSSAATAVTTPAGSSITAVAGSDISLPSDGIYCLAVVTDGTIATSSLVHVYAKLQIHNL